MSRSHKVLFTIISALCVALLIKIYLQEMHISSLEEKINSAKNEITTLKSQKPTIATTPTRQKKHPQKTSKKTPTIQPSRIKPKKTSGSQYTSIKSPIRSVGNKIYINKAYKNKIISADLGQVLQSARLEPNITQGKVLGFRFSFIRANSVFSMLGFKKEDTITSVNGTPLNDPGRAIQLLSSLKQASSIRIKFLRAGSLKSALYIVD